MGLESRHGPESFNSEVHRTCIDLRGVTVLVRQLCTNEIKLLDRGPHGHSDPMRLHFSGRCQNERFRLSQTRVHPVFHCHGATKGVTEQRVILSKLIGVAVSLLVS